VANGFNIDEIPLWQFWVPAVVFDITREAEVNGDYLLLQLT